MAVPGPSHATPCSHRVPSPVQGALRLTAPAPLLAGRVVIELLTAAAPRACENFRCLCTGERGKGKGSGKALSFLGCRFHRIVSGFVCQGGDIVKGDGSGGDSIYGKPFNDEKGGLALRHDRAGIVAMANSGCVAGPGGGGDEEKRRLGGGCL